MLSGNHDLESCAMASTSLLTATGRLFHPLLHHIPYQAIVSENDQLSQIRIKVQTVF